MDVVYSGRIENILKNLRFLGQHEDMTEFVQRMFVKQSIDVVKLVWPHPKFREMS
jgi:tRNA G46 methylase TrmB